jgi:proline racemase
MSGTNTINTVTVLLETGVLPTTEPVTDLVLETPAGLVSVRATCRDGKCESVQFENVPCFVTQLDAPVEVEGLGTLSVDVAYGGHFFALADAAALGFAILPDEAQQLAALGERVKTAAAEQLSLAHPEIDGIGQLGFVTWTAPARAGGDGRNTTVVSPGRLDRSPCGTATCARMAILAARGELEVGRPYSHEGILSTRFLGEIARQTEVGGRAAVVPRITGRSWIYASSQIYVDPTDPLPAGHTLGDTWGNGPTQRFQSHSDVIPASHSHDRETPHRIPTPGDAE